MFSYKIFSDLIRAVAILFCTKFTDLSDNIDLQEFFRPLGYSASACNGWSRKIFWSLNFLVEKEHPL